MPKRLSDISFLDLLPESISEDKTIRNAAKALDDEIQAVNDLLEVPALHARLDELDERAVELLAWQYHVDFWEQDLPLDRKRELVRGSIGWHKHKGTPWAVKKLLADTGFKDAEVIEWWQARQIYEDAGGARLDGAWTLGGSSTKQLVPYESVVGLPYLGHWAEFCVRLNLVESRWPGWNKDLLQAVETAKPARSHPVWLYWLYLELLLKPEHTYFLASTKSFPLDYPWCTPQLDGAWSLGSGGYLYTLDGTLQVDGGWAVGGRTDTVADQHLRQCNIFYNLGLQKNVERPSRHIAAKLGESKLSLDAGWQVGKNPVFALSDLRLQKLNSINAFSGLDTRQALDLEIDYPRSPQKLANVQRLQPWVHVNGKWKLGSSRKGLALNGWPLATPGIQAQAELSGGIYVETGLPERLGSYPKLGRKWSSRLDGRWYVGAHHDVDGSWQLRIGNKLSAYQLGPHYKALDSSWKVGLANKRLAGWNVGSGTVKAECEIINH